MLKLFSLSEVLYFGVLSRVKMIILISILILNMAIYLKCEERFHCQMVDLVRM